MRPVRRPCAGVPSRRAPGAWRGAAARRSGAAQGGPAAPARPSARPVGAWRSEAGGAIWGGVFTGPEETLGWRYREVAGREVAQGSGRVPGRRNGLARAPSSSPQYEMFPLPRLPQLSAAIALVGASASSCRGAQGRGPGPDQLGLRGPGASVAAAQKTPLVSDLEAICGAKQKVRLLSPFFPS